MAEFKKSKRVAVTLPEDARVFLEREAEETGVPLSNLISYITANYVREEKNRRLRDLDKYKWAGEDTQK
jgi:hypothetical protein